MVCVMKGSMCIVSVFCVVIVLVCIGVFRKVLIVVWFMFFGIR